MKKDAVSFNDFARLDLRIGEVLDAKPIDGSEKLYMLTVDLGDDYGHEVEIMAGIQQMYTPDELKGKKMIFAANLEPKAMMGHTSNGMMIAGTHEDKAILIEVDPILANGSSLR